jgi:hypothetical protein
VKTDKASGCCGGMSSARWNFNNAVVIGIAEESVSRQESLLPIWEC